MLNRRTAPIETKAVLTGEQLRARGGPYTQAEFLAMNPPVDQPAEELPLEIVQAAAEVDAWNDKHSTVMEHWWVAHHAVDQAGRKTIEAARSYLSDISGIRAEVESGLQKARVRYNELMLAHTRKCQIDEYAANCRQAAAEEERRLLTRRQRVAAALGLETKG